MDATQQYHALLTAAEYASSGDVTKLGHAILNDKDLFLTGSPYSSNHALSLILALLPESCDPRTYMQLIHDICTGKSFAEIVVEDVSESSLLLPANDILVKRNEMLLQHIEQHCLETGWSQADRRQNESLYQHWSRIRIHAIDECCGSLEPTKYFCTLEDIPWFRGIAQVLSSYRQLRPSNELVTLKQLDYNSPEVNTNLLLKGSTPDSISKDVQGLLLPYIQYTGEWSAFQQWCKDCTDLSFFVDLAYLPELTESILFSIYKYSTGTNEWDTLNKIYEILQQSQAVADAEQKPSIVDGNVEDSFLATNTSKAIQTLGKLLQLGGLISTRIPISIRQLAQIRFGSEDDQKSLTEQLILKNKGSFYVLDDDLKLLKSEGMLDKVSQSWITERVMQASLASAHFEYAKLFRQEESFETSVISQFYKYLDAASNGNKHRGSMKHASDCLDLLLTSEDYQADESVLKAKDLLDSLHEISHYTFIIKQGTPAKPQEIRQMDAYDVITKILELNSNSYKEVNKLVAIAKKFMHATDKSIYYETDDDESPEIKIKAMCVDAALVNNDLETAYDYCISDLIKTRNSLSAWTACFQVGKYVSAYWEDIPPAYIMAQQMNILSQLLDICPPENIHAVLENWKRLERLRYEAGYDSALNPPQAQRFYSKTPSSIVSTDSSESTGGRESDNHPQRKRDQISNLLVSGLGWALGATPPTER